MPDRQSGRSSGVEHNLAKVGVEGSNPFARSIFLSSFIMRFAAGPGWVGPQRDWLIAPSANHL